jgi:sec-independent protein translocase protein TatB
MLDVGFSEILLTSAIALIVLGPERLPKVARQVGNWMGRARAMARQLTEQLEREVSADELMKLQTKSEKSSSASNASGPSSTANGAAPPGADVESAPAAYEGSYTPTTPLENAAPAPPAQLKPAEYSPETAAAPHGADWHPNPPASKTGND